MLLQRYGYLFDGLKMIAVKNAKKKNNPLYGHNILYVKLYCSCKTMERVSQKT
jgi:hypothetical protein